MESFWKFITNDKEGKYYDCKIIGSGEVFMTNKCFAWFLGHKFLDTSGTLII